MQVYRALQPFATPTACALGMFDGVHPGHQRVLGNALAQGQKYGLQSVTLTFANHPQSIISKTPPLLLSTLEERLTHFDALGFDAALVLDFTPELMNLLPDTFIQKILIDSLRVKAVSVGYDHRFGRERQGDGAFLKLEGERYGFEVDVIEPVRMNEQIISSTLIRKLLSYGDLEQANRLLSRPYSITGTVEKGVGRGKTIGFPTANVTPPIHRQIPAWGVYAGLASFPGCPDLLPAVCNIGLAPTFQDQTHARIEVHILEGDYELYGQALTFTFLHYLRPEQRFENSEALVTQVKLDCENAQQLLHPKSSAVLN